MGAGHASPRQPSDRRSARPAGVPARGCESVAGVTAATLGPVLATYTAVLLRRHGGARLARGAPRAAGRVRRRAGWPAQARQRRSASPTDIAGPARRAVLAGAVAELACGRGHGASARSTGGALPGPTGPVVSRARPEAFDRRRHSPGGDARAVPAPGRARWRAWARVGRFRLRTVGGVHRGTAVSQRSSRPRPARSAPDSRGMRESLASSPCAETSQHFEDWNPRPPPRRSRRRPVNTSAR